MYVFKLQCVKTCLSVWLWAVDPNCMYCVFKHQTLGSPTLVLHPQFLLFPQADCGGSPWVKMLVFTGLLVCGLWYPRTALPIIETLTNIHFTALQDVPLSFVIQPFSSTSNEDIWENQSILPLWSRQLTKPWKCVSVCARVLITM